MIHILLRVSHFDFRYNSLNRHLLAKVHDHRDDMGAQSEWKDWSTSNQPNDQSKQSKTDQKHINTCPNEQPAKIHWCICARHRWPCAPAPPLTLTTIAIMIISSKQSSDGPCSAYFFQVSGTLREESYHAFETLTMILTYWHSSNLTISLPAAWGPSQLVLEAWKATSWGMCESRVSGNSLGHCPLPRLQLVKT